MHVSVDRQSKDIAKQRQIGGARYSPMPASEKGAGVDPGTFRPLFNLLCLMRFGSCLSGRAPAHGHQHSVYEPVAGGCISLERIFLVLACRHFDPHAVKLESGRPSKIC
jgi:hypothetical protein